MNKELKTLPEDILDLFNPKVTHEPNEENIEEFLNNLREVLVTRLREREPVDDPLRFSSLGKPARQLWYMANGKEPEELTAKTYMKFLYGDVIEQLVLFLAKEAGHTVERQQEEVNVDGVLGHIDAVIDGIVVDVKSASPFGYKKFKNNDMLENDLFGYVQQLAGYSQVLNPGKPAAWVAFDKVHGDICVTPLSSSIIKDHDPAERIKELRHVINTPWPPERCYEDKPDGKSGNRILDTGCSYCGHKAECWPNLRKFIFSNGPRYYTELKKEPTGKYVREVPIDEVQE